MHMGTKDETAGKLIQYDGESNAIGGKNIIATSVGDDILLFNESYTVVGSMLKSAKIHAMYDLIVIGDLHTKECIVNGTLTVLGNADIETLTCSNSCFIHGDITSQRMYIGGNFSARSVKCDEFTCDQNVLIQTTIDTNDSLKVEKTLVAFEGIIGAGDFRVTNAIANEYVEFDGELTGKVIELDTDTTLSEQAPVKADEVTLEELTEWLRNAFQNKLSSCQSLEEDDVVASLHEISDTVYGLSSFDQKSEELFKRLVEISYQEKLESFEDFLAVLHAKAVLPDGLYSYETVEHVNEFFTSAEESIEMFEFKPASIEEFLQAIQIINKYSSYTHVDQTVLFDIVFSSIGLRYDTVISIIRRNVKENKPLSSPSDTVPAYAPEEEVHHSESLAISREEFLRKKMSHIAKNYGLTNVELERLASLRIKTCKDFLDASEESIKKSLGKKAFLSGHIFQVRDKIAAKVAELQ